MILNILIYYYAFEFFVNCQIWHVQIVRSVNILIDAKCLPTEKSLPFAKNLPSAKSLAFVFKNITTLEWLIFFNQKLLKMTSLSYLTDFHLSNFYLLLKI